MISKRGQNCEEHRGWHERMVTEALGYSDEEKDLSQVVRFLSWGRTDKYAKVWKGKGNSKEKALRRTCTWHLIRAKGSVSVLGAERRERHWGEVRTNRDRNRSWAFFQNAMLNHQTVLSRTDLCFKKIPEAAVWRRLWGVRPEAGH